MIGRIALAIALCSSLTASALAGELPSIFGQYQAQLEGGIEAASPEEEQVLSVSAPPSAKSPRRALLLSALVPGAGQFYNGSKAKAAIFFGIEAAALGLYFNWKGEGDDIEKEFRQTADAEWDPLDYLAWRGSTISRNSSITHALPCSADVQIYVDTGSFGDCPDREVQQYYELIGKYDQFISGWADKVDKETGNRVAATEVDSVEGYLSETRLTYEDRRNDSNKFLKRASNLTGLILVNHVLSAIDAARSARNLAAGQSPQKVARRTRFIFAFHQGSRSKVPMLYAYKPFD